MAEINKRNLVDETAKVYAANTLANEPTPLFSTGMPAKIIRASIANTNLLSKDGDLFVGTGDTYTETIDGTEYTYAKIAKKNQSELFVDGLNSTATNVGLAASVGKFIDSRLYLTGSNSTTDAIGIGNGANAEGQSSIALGANAVVSSAGTNSIQLGSGTNETAMSFQVGSHQMLDLSTGKIPLDRINYQVGQKGTTTISLGGTPGTILENTVYGINATTTNIAADATAIGYSASASGGSVALGAQAYCNKKAVYGIAIGFKSALGKETEVGNLDSCIAIGNEAKIDNSFYKKDAIQLGTGTNSAGGFQVWDYQLLTAGGMIVRDRLPTLYKHRLKKDVMASGSSSGASYDTYICEWYSNKRGLPTTQFNVMGHIVKWNSQQSISTGDSLADFEFKNNNLTVKYLGGGGTIATFIYNEIKESFDVQEI